MPNSITLAKLFIDNLQKIWKEQSLTAVLENGALVRTFEGAQANEVSLPLMNLDGLSDYSKTSGYASGDATLAWVTKALTQDRGKQFVLDVMDDFESMGVVGGNLMAEFQRTKVIPEVDAYRFAKIAQGANSTHRAYGTISTGSDAVSALDAGILALDDAEVPKENRFLYCSPAFYQKLKASIGAQRFYRSNEQNINRNFEMLDDMRVIQVPSARFYLGWQKSTSGYINEGSKLNFILVHKDAVLPVIKHNPMRIFSPEVNQNADGWIFNYRLYHDCFVMPNKDNGIYIHTVESYTEETVDTPAITVTGDNTASVKFTVTGPTTGASYYYTLDGNDPTSASTSYSSQVTVTDATVPATQTVEKTIKVIGIKAGMLSSEVASKKIKVVGSGT